MTIASALPKVMPDFTVFLTDICFSSFMCAISCSNTDSDALLLQRADEAPEPDLHRAQIGDLVDLDLGVQLPGLLQNPPHLVGGDGVHAAAEAHQLYQLHVRVPAGVPGRPVEPGVVFLRPPLETDCTFLGVIFYLVGSYLGLLFIEQW